MTWLLAGLVAGVLSGAVTWLIGVFYKALYVGGLINELTVFAAFTALLVFLGGISGVTLGRYLIDRAGAYKPQRGGGRKIAPTPTCSPPSARMRPPPRRVALRPRSNRRRWQRPSVRNTARRRPTAKKAGEETRTTEAVSPAHGEEKTEKIPWPPHECGDH